MVLPYLAKLFGNSEKDFVIFLVGESLNFVKKNERAYSQGREATALASPEDPTP